VSFDKAVPRAIIAYCTRCMDYGGAKHGSPWDEFSAPRKYGRGTGVDPLG
jgi:hypothetical protein